MKPRAAEHDPCARLRCWPPLADKVQRGLQAVARKHRPLIAGGESCTCSLDLDAALRASEPRAPRWDYVLIIGGRALGLEVHPAKAFEVDAVIAKKRWAEERLGAGCALPVTRWCWVRPAGSRLQFTPLSPQARRLAQHGIDFPRARLEAASC